MYFLMQSFWKVSINLKNSKNNNFQTHQPIRHTTNSLFPMNVEQLIAAITNSATKNGLFHLHSQIIRLSPL